MNPIYEKIKEENKKLAEDIKQLRLRRKPKELRRLGEYTCKSETSKTTYPLRFPFYSRHRHIAYCELFKGRKRTEIELSSNYNCPNEELINEYKKTWLKELEGYENVRAVA